MLKMRLAPHCTASSPALQPGPALLPSARLPSPSAFHSLLSHAGLQAWLVLLWGPRACRPPAWEAVYLAGLSFSRPGSLQLLKEIPFAVSPLLLHLSVPETVLSASELTSYMILSLLRLRVPQAGPLSLAHRLVSSTLHRASSE